MQEPNYLPMHEKLYTHVHEYILVHNMDDTTKKKNTTCYKPGIRNIVFHFRAETVFLYSGSGDPLKKDWDKLCYKNNEFL